MNLLRTLRRIAFAGLLIAAIAKLVRWRPALPIARYVVEGNSMEPAFHAGDRLLVNRRAYRSRRPRVGDVVVVRDPERTGHLLLKRVARPPDSATSSGVYLLGDNAAESRDSREFGMIDENRIIGKAWRRY